MIATLSFFIVVLYRSTDAMIHQPLSPDRVHPQISSFLTLLVLCLIRPDLFVIYYNLFIFLKELISFIGSLDKCHSSIFKASIIVWVAMVYSNENTISDVSYGTNTRTISLILEGPFSDVKNESFLLTSAGASPLTIDISNHVSKQVLAF